MRTPKPLTIIALPPCDEWDELKVYEEKGHRVYRVSIRELTTTTSAALLLSPEFANALLDADLVLGDRCWRMTNLHVKYLDLAVKEARMLRYPKKEDRADVKKRDAAADDFDLGSVQPDSE